MTSNNRTLREDNGANVMTNEGMLGSALRQARWAEVSRPFEQ